MTCKKWIATAGATLAMLLTVSVASAHVGVNPAEVPPNSNQTFAVRVPNEREEPTVEVRVEFPSELVVSRFQAKPSWTRQVVRDSEQRIRAVTWSGGQVSDGEFEEFAFIARTPAEPGTLTFRADQTYRSGETVEWVNPPGEDRPAPVVEVRSGGVGTGTAGAPSVEQPGQEAVPAAGIQVTPTSMQASGSSASRSATDAEGASGSDLPLFVALGSGVLGLVALALAGIALTRRPHATER